MPKFHEVVFGIVATLGLVFAVLASGSETKRGQCGCNVTIEKTHLVDADMCPENEVMVGHPDDVDHHQIACGVVVCHCGCALKR